MRSGNPASPCRVPGSTPATKPGMEITPDVGPLQNPREEVAESASRSAPGTSRGESFTLWSGRSSRKLPCSTDSSWLRINSSVTANPWLRRNGGTLTCRHMESTPGDKEKQINVEGEPVKVGELLSLGDTFNPMFEIVEPKKPNP